MAKPKKKTETPKYPKFVMDIVNSDPNWKWAPSYPRAVTQAVNLVLNHLETCRELYPDHWVDEITEEGLEEHDVEFIKRIANAIHLARIERGF